MHRDPLTRPRVAPRALAVAALAAALAAAPAAAQTRKDPPKSARPSSAPASASTSAPAAPAVAPAAVPLPPPPAGTSLQQRRVARLSASAGPWAGLDAGQGLAVVVDYGYVRTPPTWSRFELELHLSAMISHPSDETELSTTIVPPFGTPITISSGLETMNAWVIEVVPTARVRYPLDRRFALFADGGLGLAQTIETYERDEMFAGHTETTQNQTTIVLRLGAGVSLDLSERTRIVFLPVALSLQLDTGFSAYAPTLGLAYRL